MNLLIRPRHLSLLALLFFLPFLLPASAQQKSKYSLLWKISGNGLLSPSYLFGTMHVKDKRVFNFSDSVMLAIQRCDGFALEVHPDTLMKKMFNTLQTDDSTRDIRKLLSKSDYTKLAKKFEEKNGYPMGKINPLMAESLVKTEKDKPGDKKTFVDAYLYGVAKTMGKTIYGLEDATRQFKEMYGTPDDLKVRLEDLLDNGVQEAINTNEEELVKVYSTGDLNFIEDVISRYKMNDSSINARNKVMVSSMIRYMSGGRSLFTAVGTAHLPGKAGIIALMKKAGYTVEPVTANFTGVANTFKIDYEKMPWFNYADKELGYSIEFPAEPIKSDLFHNFNTVVYPDLSNEVYYGSFALPMGTVSRPAEKSAVINKIINNMIKNRAAVVISKKEVLLNGLSFTDIIAKSGGNYIRYRMLVINNILYSAYMVNKRNEFYQVNDNRFFNSFKYVKVDHQLNRNWVVYTNPTAAFSIRLPVLPQSVVKEVANPIKKSKRPFILNMFVSTDTLNLQNYLIRYNDYPSGTYLADQNLLLNSLGDEFKGRGTIEGDIKKITKDGYEGRELRVTLKGGYYCVLRIYARGGRVYMLLKQNMQENVKEESNDDFFNSFKFIPFQQPDYYTYRPEGENFSVKMPSKPVVLEDSSKDYNSYLRVVSTSYATNPLSGGTYGIEHDRVSKYYRLDHPDSLYHKLITKLVKEQDTLLKIDTVLINGKKGREFITQRTGTNIKRRSRVLFDGEDLYYLTTRLSAEEYDSETPKVFFNSLTKNATGKDTVDLSSSKSKLIVRDLQSADTVIHAQALGALGYYQFKKEELPDIYAALDKPYPDDSLYTGTRNKLIRLLGDLHDSTTLHRLKELYPSLKAKDMVKVSLLNVLPDIDKTKGYDLYLKFLTTDTPLQIVNYYRLFLPLRDSLAYTAANFSRILPLIKYPEYRQNIISLANKMAYEKNDRYDRLLKDNFRGLTRYAKSDLEQYLKLKDSTHNAWGPNVYNYLELMGTVKGQPLTNDFTRELIAGAPKGYYINNAVIARVNNKLPTSQLLINRLLDSIYNRYDLMEALYKQKQLAKVPPKYRTQTAFASLCLYPYVGADDYGSPEKISLLGSLTVKGKVYYAFKFNLPERDEKAALVGITGPYQPGSSVLNFKQYLAYTDYDPLKLNWKAQARKMIPNLLDQYKDR
jgi:uncharacterized protein YbaP (TraB family)